MAERKKAAGRTKRPRPANVTDEFIEAGRANLAKGRARQEERREEARKQGKPPAGQRHAMLLDGSLKVEDLDDDELRLGRVRGQDGGFTGRRKPLPAHIVSQMQAEAIKRAQAMFAGAAPAAVKRLLEIAADPDTKDSDAIRALQLVMERSMGKVPDTVRVEAADAWGKLLREASPDQIDRDMGDD